jgi:predicted glycosyltransferase
MRLPSRLSETRDDSQRPSGMRFLLYCHDTYGLGHLRRTLSLAEHFTTRIPDAEVLIVTGSPMAHAFVLPPRVDYIKLPAVTKELDGSYHARDLTLEFPAIRDLRAALLYEAARAYQPDVFIVDHAPQGWKGEALPTLAMLKATRPDCLCVLGLRDIVDASHIVRKSWTQEEIYSTLEQAFDLILVYGSQRVFDLATEYALPTEVASRLRYCGYLSRVKSSCQSDASGSALPVCLQSPVTTFHHRPLVVLTAGGGGDGFPLMHTYLAGLRQLPKLSLSSILITGPLMPEHDLHALQKIAATLPAGAVHIESFLPDPLPLLKAADLVVAMAGYNTTCELLELKRRTLLVPRTVPRQEQLLRSKLLAQHGLVDMLHPDDLRPEILIERVRQALARPEPTWQQTALAGITFSGQSMALQAIVDGLSQVRSRSCESERVIAQVC